MLQNGPALMQSSSMESNNNIGFQIDYINSCNLNGIVVCILKLSMDQT